MEFYNTDFSGLKQAADNIRAEIGKIIIGQHEMVDQLILALLANGHVLIEGVPGIAKTLTAKLTARTLSVNFSRIQFTPDLMPSDVTGTSIFNVKTQDFEFRKGPIFSNLVLCDEINRAPAKTQAALFECMQEKQVTVDGVSYPMDAPFLVIATQNPIEQEGTYRLPEAQLDRFLFKIVIDYPTLEEEVRILKEAQAHKGDATTQNLNAILSRSDLMTYRETCGLVKVEEKLIEYIARIVNKTRNNSVLYLGASPRASLAILASAKAKAAISGRDFVIPEDIQYVAIPVLRHRVQLTPEKEMEGSTVDKVISDLLATVEVPR